MRAQPKAGVAQEINRGGGCNAGYVPNQAGTACVKKCLPPNFINPNYGQCEEHRYTITIEPNGAVLPSGVEYTIEPIASLPLKT